MGPQGGSRFLGREGTECMKNYDKLLFVSGSNTSVSPMAEAIMQEALRLEDILIDSRGLVVLFPEPVNPKSEAILVSNGLTMKGHTSTPFSKDDFDERTLILTMDQGQKEKLLNEYENSMNVYTLAEFVGWDSDVPDPYGGVMADYGHCFEQLKSMLALLTDKL